MSNPAATPEEHWPTVFVTRDEWEESKQKHDSQRKADLFAQCQDRETLNEIKADVKTLVEWMNQEKGAAEGRKKTLKEFDSVRQWVDGVRRTAINIGAVAAVLVAIATFFKLVVIPLIVQYYTKG